MGWRASLGVWVFAILLFGYSMVGGRPLTMHEAVLPQTAREMLVDGDWIVPKAGGRPWLERPPLPQWVTAAVGRVAGGCDREWVVRLAPALLGSLVVLLVARMAAGWLDRQTGILSGLVLATMLEFANYARLAEADIFLCALVTLALGLFAKIEFAAPLGRTWRFLGPRPWPVLAFFLLVGTTNLAKGLLFGPAMVVLPVATFLLLAGDAQRLGRYVWLWGWLAAGLVALAWPIAVYQRYPDVLELWAFDHVGRLTGRYAAINQPLWYYPVTLTWAAAPWTLALALGLVRTVGGALNQRTSAERFLWCWALAPIAVLSLASGKHHHYLLHCLAPWAVLGAIGLRWFWDELVRRPAWRRSMVWTLGLAALAAPAALAGLPPGAAAALWPVQQGRGPQWLIPVAAGVLGAAGCALGIRRIDGRWALGSLLATVFATHCWGHSVLAPHTDRCLDDTQFVQRIAHIVPEDATVLVNADLGSMDLFRILFYLDCPTRAVHNLTYLRQPELRGAEVYLIARHRDEERLVELGTAEPLLRSRYSRRETGPADRLTLFRINLRHDPGDWPAPPTVSPMQAMSRAEGPFVGPRL